MKWWLLAAGLLAAALAPQAFAADLDDGEGPPPPPPWKWKDGSYGYPPKEVPPPGYYEDDDRPSPYSKKYSYEGPPYKKYDDDGYGPPPPYFKKYGDKAGCVRSEQVRDRLTSMGWRDFHAGKAVNETMVTLRARRPTGRLFELRLDRCSGEIITARPLDWQQPYYGYKRPPSWGPYGYAPYSDGPQGYMGPYAGRPYGYGKRPPGNWDD